MKFRTPFAPRKRMGVDLVDALVTVQGEALELDVNRIMARAAAGGGVPVRAGQPLYGDFSDFPDFHEAQNRVVKAQEAFRALPSKLRARFRNDPGELLRFVADEKNRAEAEELGLVAPRPKPAPDVPPAAPAPPSPGKAA